MKYRVIAYMRIDPEEEELFDSYEEAIREKENLDAMEWPNPMNIYKIEEADVLNAVPKEKGRSRRINILIG